MILETASNHFTSDLQRARNLLSHARQIQGNESLKCDILRSSLMMGVGATDAFFCDAYGDLVARTLRAKTLQPLITTSVENIMIPASVVIGGNVGSGWLWRMVARSLIEKDNVLSLKKVQDLFNQFCRDNHKLFNANSTTFENWILHRNAKSRLFGVTATQLRNSTGNVKANYKKDAAKQIKERFIEIFQRRNDCIHNCDRPKVVPQQISVSFVVKSLDDIEFVVLRCTEALREEFPRYLLSSGFNAVTRNQVCL